MVNRVVFLKSCFSSFIEIEYLTSTITGLCGSVNKNNKMSLDSVAEALPNATA